MEETAVSLQARLVLGGFHQPLVISGDFVAVLAVKASQHGQSDRGPRDTSENVRKHLYFMLRTDHTHECYGAVGGRLSH